MKIQFTIESLEETNNNKVQLDPHTGVSATMPPTRPSSLFVGSTDDLVFGTESMVLHDNNSTASDNNNTRPTRRKKKKVPTATLR